LTVPFLDLKREYQSIRPAMDAALAEVVASQGFILGPKVEALERDVAAFCGVRRAVAVASGTDALLLALMALGIQPEDEVITTPFTFFATAGCIARLGARPVFADIEPTSFNIDPHEVARRLTPRTRAVIAVDLYGQPADYRSLKAVTEPNGIPIIEDAAQSFGATLDGRRAGALADFGCLSFYPTKNLGGYGDGGMVLVDDETTANLLVRLREHGESRTERRYYHLVVGVNSRLDALQAAVLLVKLAHVEEWNARRAALAARYNAAFADTSAVTPHLIPGATHVYHQYVIRVPDGAAVRAALTAASVGNAVFYPVPLHLQPCFAHLGYRLGDFPHAERAASQVVALPIFPFLTDAEQNEVIREVRSAVGPARP
jgi:dTDP-4-amino-4,6-dideoxygalactose transaminase